MCVLAFVWSNFLSFSSECQDLGRLNIIEITSDLVTQTIYLVEGRLLG